GGGGPVAFILARAGQTPPAPPAVGGRNPGLLDPQPPASAPVSASASTQGNCSPSAPPPTLTGIQPASGAQGSSFKVTLTGTQFVSPSVAISGQGDAVNDVLAGFAGVLTGPFSLVSGAALRRPGVLLPPPRGA